MGHSNTAEALLKAVQGMIDMALRPFDEQERRTAGLLAQTRDEIGRDRQANHETEKEHAKAIAEVENRMHALAKRVDMLESGRTGRVEYLRPQGPPPGVPALPGSGGNERAIDRAFDPTTWAIERGNMERDELRRQMEHARALLSIERKEHAVDREARDQLASCVPADVELRNRHNGGKWWQAVATTIADLRRDLEGYKDGQERMTKARDAALKGRDELGAQVTKLQRELRDAKASVHELQQQAQRRIGIDERRLARLAERFATRVFVTLDDLLEHLA